MEEEEEHEILEFFSPHGKWRWKVIHMGALNASPKFVALMMKLHIGWYTLAKKRVLKNVASKLIVDDVLLYGHKAEQLLDYFIMVLGVLKHQRTTLKLKICKWFQYR